MTRASYDFEDMAKKNPTLLQVLLKDRTTNKNILWASNSYQHLGKQFEFDKLVTLRSLTGRNAGTIQRRYERDRAHKLARTRTKAEVFTPTWYVNDMINSVDMDWFGTRHAFNTPKSPREEGNTREWESTTRSVAFDARSSSRTWLDYVDSLRLEVTCGEGAFLASPYDAATGESLPLSERVGMLDRKLRVVTENATNEHEWLTWSLRALHDTYGYELQGDSVLIARINVLASYAEYLETALCREPTLDELMDVAEIVSWNI